RPPEWQQPQWGPQEPQWQQQHQQPWGPPMYSYQPGQRAPGSATAALILGICAGTLCAPICGPLALIFRYQARRHIANSNGTRDGSGMGLAGIIMGWIAVALTVAVVLAIVIIAANQS